MVTIQIDDATAEALERQAKIAGMSVVEFLRHLIPDPSPAPRADWEQIELEIMALSSHGPSLPDDFSRADIYNDHD